jgi:hypothetical protein
MTQLTTLEGNVTFLFDTASKIEQNLTYINNQIQQQQTTITQLNNTVNTISTNINNILNQYTPIDAFQYNSINFTDYHGNSSSGSLHGVWYRPITLQPSSNNNDGVDLKYLLLVIRGISISKIPNNGNFFYSDPLPLPIPFVNNNNFRVFWNSGGTGDLMNTIQSSYYVNNVPINYWSLGVRAATNQHVSNDSVCFIIMYI